MTDAHQQHPLDRPLYGIPTTGPVDRELAMREAITPYVCNALDALVAAGCAPTQAITLFRQVLDGVEQEAGLASTTDTPNTKEDG